MLKKLTAFLLALLMLFSATACMGEFQFGIAPGGGTSGGEEPDDPDNEGGYVPPTMNDDPTDDFVVTLMADGQPYSPRMEMFAYWNNGSSIYTAKFDENGVARIDGLDGDYRVSLSAVPNEYTYNPNGNKADNFNRSIVVDLYTLNHLAGGGTGVYDCYSFQKTGVYCATINGPEDAVFFQYAPDGMGEYSVESWADTVADNIDPDLDVYYGSSQWKAFERTIDYSPEAPCGSYAMNFIHTVQIASENISSAGQAVYTFAIKAESKNNKYPIVVTFAVKRNGDFELPETVGPGGGMGTGKVMAVPTYDFSEYDVADHEYGSDHRIVYPEYHFGGNTYVFDQSRFKLWKKSDGGDDFYHVYDEEKYASTGGYGPILYANITTRNRFLDAAFTRVEYNSKGEIVNAALSSQGTNYKHLIEGYTVLAQVGYYCIFPYKDPITGEVTPGCPCHDEEGESKVYACLEGCTSCAKDCRQCLEELIGFEGYQAYVNSKGLVPVTEDIQKFLLGYSKKQTFFYDGQGSLETSSVDGKYFQAVGDSGWLFGCCYYEPVAP